MFRLIACYNIFFVVMCWVIAACTYSYKPLSNDQMAAIGTFGFLALIANVFVVALDHSELK